MIRFGKQCDTLHMEPCRMTIVMDNFRLSDALLFILFSFCEIFCFQPFSRARAHTHNASVSNFICCILYSKVQIRNVCVSLCILCVHKKKEDTMRLTLQMETTNANCKQTGRSDVLHTKAYSTVVKKSMIQKKNGTFFLAFIT